MIYEFVRERMLLLMEKILPVPQHHELQMNERVMCMHVCPCVHTGISVLVPFALGLCGLEASSTVCRHWRWEQIVIIMPTSHSKTNQICVPLKSKNS